MKKIFIAIVSVIASVNMMAQTENGQETSNSASAALEQMLVYENPKILVSIGEIKYVPKKAVDQVKSTAVSVLGSTLTKDRFKGTEVPIEDESMVPEAKEVLRSGVNKAFRFTPFMTDFTSEQLSKQPCLKYTATITGCNTTVQIHDKYNDKLVTITAFVYLTDPKTGEVKASKEICGNAWVGSFSTFDDAKRSAIYNLQVSLIDQLNSWYPLRGHMLEKGFQKGKKQKLKEIYIDLGSKDKLGTGYTCNVYTVRRIAGRIARKYIGRGKVAEVLGEDISSVTLKKGADVIKEAFDNGAEIAVSVN